MFSKHNAGQWWLTLGFKKVTHWLLLHYPINNCMDKQILKLFFAILFPASAFGQPVMIEKPVLCAETATVMNGIASSQYGEKPSWIGADEKSKFTLFVNEKTKTWTLIQFDNNVACIIGVGDGSTNIFLGPKT